MPALASPVADVGCVQNPIASLRFPLIPNPSPHERPSSPTLLPSERGEGRTLRRPERPPLPSLTGRVAAKRAAVGGEGECRGERCLPHDLGFDASANVTSGIGPTPVTPPDRPTLHPAWSRSVAPDRARGEGWRGDRGRARPDRPACRGRSSLAGPRGR